MLLYSSEHIHCFNYEKKADPALDIKHFRSGETLEKEVFDTSIVFTLAGKCRYSCGKEVGKALGPDRIVLFPPGSRVRMEFEELTTLVVSRMQDVARLCECYPIDKLYQKGKPTSGSPCKPLAIHPEVRDFLDHYIRQTQNGLKCFHYSDLKNKELLYLFRTYYPKQELSRFFEPLLSNDVGFTQFIYRNYRKVGSVQELIELSQYSVSGFKKQFSRTFGMSASEWLREQKARLVFHELNCSSLSIKELCYKFDFASVPSFSAFCKSHFGLPPGEIRKKLHIPG